MCLQKCSAPRAADYSASYGYMCYFELRRCEVGGNCAVRQGGHPQASGLPFSGYGKIRVGGEQEQNTSIYWPPEASKTWGEGIITGAGGWEGHLIAGDCNSRCDENVMQGLAKGRAAELDKLQRGEKVLKERAWRGRGRLRDGATTAHGGPPRARPHWQQYG